MPVELITFRAPEVELGRGFGRGGRALFVGNEAHHSVTVMPGGLIGDQFARLLADGAEQNHPGQHLGVAHFVQLLVSQFEQRVVVAAFHVGDGPPVEIERRLRILPGARIVRHAAAGDNRDPIGRLQDRVADGGSQLCAAAGGGQRRQVRIYENRNHRHRAALDHPLVDGRERVAQLGVLRVRQIETVGNQIVQDFFGEGMYRQRVALAGKRGLRFLASDDGESGHGGQEKCFQVVASDHHHRIGLDLIQVLAKLAHRCDVGIQLRFVLARRIGE